MYVSSLPWFENHRLVFEARTRNVQYVVYRERDRALSTLIPSDRAVGPTVNPF